MANINPIANSETGISVRNKLNALITKAQTTSGSLNILSGSFEDFSGSYVTESGSLADRIADNSGSIAVLSSSYQLVSASYTEFSSSYIVDSGSFSASIAEVSTSLAPISASIALLSSSFLTVSESYYEASASFSSSIAELSASLQPLSSSIALLSSSFLDFSESYNSGSFSGSFQGDGSGLTGLDIPEGGLDCVDTYVKYAQGNPEYPTPIAYTGTTFSVATQAELVTALTNAVQGDIISLSGDIDVTSTVTVNKGVRITGNGFAIQNANTSNTVVHVLDITAANVYIDSTLTVKQRKTNNTSVDSAIRVNGTNFVSEAIVEFMEFGYVLNNGTFSISGELRYRGALGNSHRHIAVYGMSGNSKIENLSFDFVQETTARANLIVLLGNTIKQGTLRVANTVMTTADYCRQFFFLESWTGITPRNFNLIFHNNVFNDLNGGIGLFSAPQPPLDYFGYISLTNNIQGDAAQLSSGYKGLVFFDGGTNKDLGTTDLYYSRNEPADLPLRADYTSAYEGIAYRNTIFTNNIPLVPISDCLLIDAALGGIIEKSETSIAALSASFVEFSSSYNTGSFTGSFEGDGSGLTGLDAFPYTGSAEISGSLTVTGSVLVKGDMDIDGKITAKVFESQLISSSIIYESGSTKFGDSMDDTHQFTGSVQISGSLIVNSVQIASASIASGSISNAISASYIPFSGVEGLLEYTSSISASITQLSSSFEIVSSSYAEASASFSSSIASISSSFVDFSASYMSGSFSGSFQGDGSKLTGLDAFPYTGSAEISGSLTVTGSVNISGSLTVNGVDITNNGGDGGAPVTISTLVPSGSVQSGSLWWNQTEGNLYIQVESPTGSVYVPATNTVAGGNYGATLTIAKTGSVWDINHNLNTTTPLVAVYSGSSVIIPESITSVDANNIQITFSTSVEGTAVISTGIGSDVSSVAGNPATYLKTSKTNAQSVGNSFVLLTWSSSPTLSINAGEWDNFTGVFTATKAGIYQVTAQLQLASTGYTLNDLTAVSIRKNISSIQGTGLKYITNNATQFPPSSSTTAIVQLSVGDTIGIYAYSDRANFTHTTGTNLSIQELPTLLIN